MSDGYCQGWRKGAAACRRLATPGYLTCTIHRHQEALVDAMIGHPDPTPTVAFTMRQPDRIANLNDRTHWAVRHKVTRNWRTATALQARRVGGVPVPANVHIRFDVPDSRRRDAHNTAPVVKACVDGLVDAGWFPDDCGEYVTIIDPTFRVVGRKADRCVTITATRR